MDANEIMAEMQSIMDRADARPDGQLSAAEVTRCDTLQSELRRAQHASNREVVTAAVIPGAPRRENAPAVSAGFTNYLRTGTASAEFRAAQSEGTPSEGGYLVPAEFRRKVVDRLKAFGGLAGAADEIVTATGATLSWPTVDDVDNLGEVVLEGGTWVAGSDLVFGSASLGAHRYSAGGAGGNALRLSVELVQDAAIDVVGLVSDKLAERLHRVIAQHLVTGTGVNQPKGIVHGRTGVQTAATTGGIKYDDLVGWVHSVDPAYRPGSVWMFNDSTLEEIRKIKDIAGDPLWRPSVNDPGVMSVSGSLLGYPVVVDQAFPDFVNNSATVNFGVFGNVKRGYLIRHVKDVTLAVNPYARMNYGQIEYSAWCRLDAIPTDTRAFSVLTGKA